MVAWLHMLPIVGTVFGPFDLMHTVKQAEQIEDLSSKFGKTLERDLNKAIVTGRVAPGGGRFGGNSVEFAPLHERLARHELEKRRFVARLRPVQAHALHAQRAIAMGGAASRPNLVRSTFRAHELLKRRDFGA